MTTIAAISAYNTSLAKLQAGFKTSDADKNGALSRTEFETAANANTGVLNGQSAAAAFKKLDANNDGQLTKSEISTTLNLSTQVQSVLLQGQELASGSAFAALLGSTSNTPSSLFGQTNNFNGLTSSLLGGGSSSSSLISTLTGANANTSTSAGLFGGLSSSTNALIQQLLSRYADTLKL